MRRRSAGVLGVLLVAGLAGLLQSCTGATPVSAPISVRPLWRAPLPAGTDVPTGPGSSSYTPQTAALAAADASQPRADVQSFGSGAQNVVFQHGFISSGKTWDRMRGWLNPLFEFGRETVPSLPSTDRLASQGTDLVNLLSGAQNDSVLIGHSNGGLISRDVAQRRPDLATGVLTMDTPHQGVLLDLTGRAALAGGLSEGINSLASLAGCTSPGDNAACALAAFLAVDSFPMVNFALDSASRASRSIRTATAGPPTTRASPTRSRAPSTSQAPR
jgi:pimeloyl-ACP methyl ester carboxylesterase